jgi:hypothetical protein
VSKTAHGESREGEQAGETRAFERAEVYDPATGLSLSGWLKGDAS